MDVSADALFVVVGDQVGQLIVIDLDHYFTLFSLRFSEKSLDISAKVLGGNAGVGDISDELVLQYKQFQAKLKGNQQQGRNAKIRYMSIAMKPKFCVILVVGCCCRFSCDDF